MIWWRLLLFGSFIGFAAPMDIILPVWSGYASGDQTKLVRPLTEAIVYIYAFVLAVETLFRVSQHHDIIPLKPWLRCTQGAAVIVIFFFLIDYMNYIRPLVEAHTSALDTAKRQVLFATLAFAASLGSFLSCESGKRAISGKDTPVEIGDDDAAIEVHRSARRTHKRQNER